MYIRSKLLTSKQITNDKFYVVFLYPILLQASLLYLKRHQLLCFTIFHMELKKGNGADTWEKKGTFGKMKEKFLHGKIAILEIGRHTCHSTKEGIMEDSLFYNFSLFFSTSCLSFPWIVLSLLPLLLFQGCACAFCLIWKSMRILNFLCWYILMAWIWWTINKYLIYALDLIITSPKAGKELVNLVTVIVQLNVFTVGLNQLSASQPFD